jgi:Zn-dependent protease with chaperone function
MPATQTRMAAEDGTAREHSHALESDPSPTDGPTKVAAEVSGQACPECGVELPVLTGYVTWCHDCGWNLRAPERPKPSGRFEALYQRVGERLGNRLVERLLEEDRLAPRWTPSRVGAFLIAGIVHLVAAALLVLTIVIGIASVRQPFGLILVVPLAGITWLVRPRLGKKPKNGVVPKSEAPSLYALCDEIATALGTRPVDAIVIDHHFNASWAVRGIRRTRTLTLGLPLLAVLPPQVRVALIAHELAHGRNGDARRGLFVGGAVNSLAEVYYLLAPTRRVHTFGEQFLNWVFWVLSRPTWWLLQLELHLLLRDTQRAEYLADLLAAQVAGADAVVELHERLLLESTFYGVVHHAARQSTQQLLEDALDRLDAVPERERERRRRVARLETARLDSTHPPTASRIRLVEARGGRDPQVVVDPERSAAIDRDLDGRRHGVEQRLVDDYRSSLYA